VVQRIDDIVYANYNVPTLQHQHRVLIHRDHDGGRGVDYVYQESDYVDAREYYTYDASHFALKTIGSHAELKRLTGINVALERALSGKSVSIAQLRRLLTPSELAEYVSDVATEKHPSEIKYIEGMPSELRDYNIMLREADFMNARYESMSGKASVGKAKYAHGTLTKFSTKAESLYESALERLEEIYSVASPYERYQLDTWMDREVDFERGIERTVGMEPESIPRVRGSSSSNALDSGLPKLSKRLKQQECALTALVYACCAIAFDLPVSSNDDAVLTSADAMAQKKLLQTKLQRLLSSKRDEWD
jgi:hypothetical protein